MSPELKGRQLLNIIGAMSLWVSLKWSTTGSMIEDTDELKEQQSSSMSCNMAAIKKKLFNLYSCSILSARFTLFWFWPQPITTHETDIQKWQWLVTSQTYCACSCCNSTAQARHYGQLLVLRRHGLVTGYLGGVLFHLRSLVNPPTTTKERKKHCAYENSSVCVRLALSKIYWSCWILQSCPILPHCYDRYGLLRAVDGSYPLFANSRYSEHLRSLNLIITSGHSVLRFVRYIWSAWLIRIVNSSLYEANQTYVPNVIFPVL